MAITDRSNAKERPAERVYYGFNSLGGIIKSATPVDNAVTRIAREVCGFIRTERWTPADVIADLARRPAFYQDAFGVACAGPWSVLDQFYQWPSATVARSLHQYLKARGDATPPWLKDENAWEAECDAWERVPGRQGRVEHAAANRAALDAFMGGLSRG